MKPESPFYEHCRSILKSSELFADMDNADLEVMMRIYHRETWPKGAQIPSEQAKNYFSVIISGRVELTRINADTGRQLTLFTLSPGDAFDVITLLDGKEHDINPVALEPLEIIAAPLNKARKWIETNSAFNGAILPYMADKVRILEHLSADLALYDTFTRLAELILEQATPEYKLDAKGHRCPPLVNTLSDEAMARMIGSVRVVVNRHIQEFVKMGLITTSRGRLVVRDLEKLRDYCEKLTSK